MKMVSLDQGRTFISARELELILADRPELFSVLVQSMDKATREAAHRFAPCSAADFIWFYLTLAREDLIIG